jgi:hypothetical protein
VPLPFVDPTSAYHLAQIVGMVLLYRAVRGRPALVSVSRPPRLRAP